MALSSIRLSTKQSTSLEIMVDYLVFVCVIGSSLEK